MAVNTWDGAADTDWDTAGNWDTTGATDRVPTSADDVIIPDTSALNNPTLGGTANVKSLTIATDGTVVGGGQTIIIHDEGDGSGGTDQYAAHIQGIISGELSLDQRTQETGYLRLSPSSGNIHDLTINHADCVSTLGNFGDVTLTGDLTITAGQLTTSGNNVNLTVTGGIDITGTLTSNASTITALAMRINSGGTYNATSGTTTLSDSDIKYGRVLTVHTDGIFNHNKGLMKFTGGSMPEIEITGQSLTKNPFYNLQNTNNAYWATNAYVLNNATIAGTNYAGATGYTTVLGICENTAGDYNAASHESTSANHFFGTFILSGGTLRLSPMEITVGSFRNTGGTVS